MVLNELLDIRLLDLCDPSRTRMADYMLSGIFDWDLHRVPELQYRFKTGAIDNVSEQILKLDSHIHAFTSRNLSYDSDSLNAFLGVSARYSADNGLFLLLGMPVFAGLFANGKPELQHKFALSLSSWTHAIQRVAEDADIYVVDCPRRAQFPSWTWVGWKGQVNFGATASKDEDGDEDESADCDDNLHAAFFDIITSKGWVAGINRRLWSAEMMLHTTDGREATLLTGRASGGHG